MVHKEINFRNHMLLYSISQALKCFQYDPECYQQNATKFSDFFLLLIHCLNFTPSLTLFKAVHLLQAKYTTCLIACHLFLMNIAKKK